MRAVIGFVLGALLGCAPLQALTLHHEQADPSDLRVTGILPDAAEGEVRFVRYEDIAALPTSEVKGRPEWLHEEHTFTIVFFRDFIRALAPPASADLMLVNCGDGYQANYSFDFIATYKPFFIVKIDGKPPSEWPGNAKGNRGPYYVSVSEKIVPAYAQLLDGDSKRPFGVAEVKLANAAKTFAPLYQGSRAHGSPLLIRGREMFIDHCSSCHATADGSFGGKVSSRPIEILSVFAQNAPDYLIKQVTDPKQFDPKSKMPAHSHYTEKEFDALIAFLAAK